MKRTGVGAPWLLVVVTMAILMHCANGSYEGDGT